ncbi:aminotransferase class I/II-fold pyridoxal phosphate-dependent enzyme [Nocardiopsis ganjiahuensis]|uniref:aminotransferase class I/II-fold pyridoxal phosphate-dependent enzyme n=1 Tax=Nocardiopsis ganjiahuensis TaxID=239984 RepID=UPI00034886C6|nr:aminotransferase class I/II-fold pyridoxal phosphate-dependent enzyme [Nocardiopsis ganjiahuensis]
MERLDTGTRSAHRPWPLRATPPGPAPGPLPSGHPLAWLDGAAEGRARAGLTRRTVPRSPSDGLLDLAGNDYLGLMRHPAVVAAAAEAARTWGAGAGGSRLVTGDTRLHGQLERELAAFHGAEAALVFSSGYAANLAMVTALVTPAADEVEPPLVVCDQYNHASLIDATRLAKASGARVAVFPHGDTGRAAELLSGGAGRRLLLSDTVFSVDGDLADVRSLAGVARAHGAALLLDDAHGLGVVGPGGRGAVGGTELGGADDVVVSVTLSKSLGSQGGAVLGSRRVIRHLVETARTFVFDTGLAPAATGAALAALRVLRAEPERAEAVRARARELSEGLRERGLAASAPAAAVVSVPAPSPEEALAWRAACLEDGVRVGCFRPPSVPDGRSRLRLTARATLDDADIRRVLDVITANRPG